MLFLPILVLAGLTMASGVNFTMSVDPPPQPGQPFTITWAPTSSAKVTLVLNNFDDSDGSYIIDTTYNIAYINNTGSYTWNVPSDLCGRHSFSLDFQFEVPAVFGTIWDAPSCYTSTTITVAKTTASCTTAAVATPTGQNPFLVPNSNDYPFRAGQTSYVSWTPTTSGTVSLILQKTGLGGGNQTTIADSIPNSGFFAWTPDSSLIDINTIIDEATTTAYTLTLVTSTSSTTSPTLWILSPSALIVFANTTSWIYPTVGQTTTIQWSANSDATISIQLVYGAGAVPTSSNTIIIADNVPNTGSFVWDVPSTFETGQYILQGLSATGAWVTNLITIIVGDTPVLACGSSGSTTSPVANQARTTSSSSSGSSSDSSTRAELFSSLTTLSPSYAQILHLSTCVSSLTPVYTSHVASGTTTSFHTIGCPASTTATTTATATSTPGCFSGYSTFSVSGSSSVCCPSSWSTSSLGEMYCYTSAPAGDVWGWSTAKKRSLGGTQTTSSSAEPTVFLENYVFARAGVVTSGVRSRIRSGGEWFSVFCALVGVLILV